MPESFIQLTGTSEKIQGLRWEAAEVLRIGRHPSAEVVVQDTSVEKLHAEIKFHGQRWLARPLTSDDFYPTLLNQSPLPNRGVQVRLRDVLQVGSLTFQVTALGQESVDLPTVATLDEQKTTTTRIPPARLAAISATPPPSRQLPPLSARETPPPQPQPTVTENTRPGFLVLTGCQSRPVLGSRPAVSISDRTPSPDRPDMQVLRVEACTQRTWDQALEQATQSLCSRPDSGRAVLTLLRANHHLSNHSRLEDLLQNILADALGALNAQRGAILLFDPKSNQLEVQARHASPPSAVGKKGYSKTLAERCFRQGESILCRDLRADQDPNAARSALAGSMSSIVCALLRTPRRHLGVLHLDRGPFDEPFSESDLYLADAVAANVAIGIECAQLVETQSGQFLETVTTLARAVEMRDQYTGDHTRRVTEFSLLMADDLKVSPAARYQLEIGTPLHDLGKIGIDDAVLRKPGKLTPGEFEHMKSHTVKGAAMLDGFVNLAPLVPIIRHHHERWDGTGYPDRIGREDISLSARIVAVADAFDAMTSHRPYRPALPTQLAFLELLSKAGTHFDPTLVQSFVRLRPKVEAVMKCHQG